MLFGIFGFGALVLSPVVMLMGSVERGQPVVRAAWRLMVWLFVGLGLIRIDRGNLPCCRGTIIVANHPSLIDVLLLTVLMPQTLSMAKRAVARNPFMGIVSRATAITVGADLEREVAPYLARGWNVLIFPEGTRSPWKKPGRSSPSDTSVLHPFRRGAAQLALRSSAPVICVGVRQSRRILAKHQPIWDLGPARVHYGFAADKPTIERIHVGESRHMAAIRVTMTLEQRMKGLLA